MSTPRKKLADQFISSLPANARHREFLVVSALGWARDQPGDSLATSMLLDVLWQPGAERAALRQAIAVGMAGCVDVGRRAGLRFLAGEPALMPPPDVVDDLEALGLVERSANGREVGMPHAYRLTSFADRVLPLVCARRAG